MSNLGAPLPDRTPSDGKDAPSAEDSLVATFDVVKDELLSTLVYLLGNREDAHDAAQEAFLKCWRARASLPDVQNVRAWVFRVAMNTARDSQRSAWSRRVRTTALEDLSLVAQEIAPADAMEDREALDRLRRAIADLRPEEKEVFLLRQNGELTYEQIAEIRQAPVGTVKTQMRAALMKLKKVLNPADPTEVGP
jgi:RNA polymerase sigma-70 factor, ECF subfamily